MKIILFLCLKIWYNSNKWTLWRCKNEIKESKTETLSAINENRKAINAFSVKYNLTELDSALILDDIKKLKSEIEKLSNYDFLHKL